MSPRFFLCGFLGLLSVFGLAASAHADMIDIRGRLIRQDGTPLADQKVRVVVGSEKDSRAPTAGAAVVTDRDGRFLRTVEAPVERRWITLDSFLPHRPLHIAVGVEMELLGRRALYWIDLDSVKSGTVGQMRVFFAGPDGRFDRPMAFSGPPPVYTFPGEPNGAHLTGIGAELKVFEMEPVDLPDGKRRWTVRIEIEKHEFRRR